MSANNDREIGWDCTASTRSVRASIMSSGPAFRAERMDIYGVDEAGIMVVAEETAARAPSS